MCGYAAVVCRGMALWRSARPKRARREGEVSAVEAEGMLEKKGRAVMSGPVERGRVQTKPYFVRSSWS